MTSKAFRELAEDLKVGELSIKPESFYKAYMKKIAPTQEVEKGKSNDAPQKQMEKEHEGKTSEKVNENKTVENQQGPIM